MHIFVVLPGKRKPKSCHIFFASWSPGIGLSVVEGLNSHLGKSEVYVTPTWKSLLRNTDCQDESF